VIVTPGELRDRPQARSVRIVQQHQQDYPSVTASAAVATQLGLSRETLQM